METIFEKLKENVAKNKLKVDSIEEKLKYVSRQVANIDTKLTQCMDALEGTLTAQTQTATLAPQPTVIRQTPAKTGAHTDNFTTGPTFKPTRKAPQPQAPKPVMNPLNAHHPSRLIVQVLPNGLQPADRPEPEQLNHEINKRLTSHTKSSDPKVVSHKWRNNGHCIIFTRTDQTAAELEHEHWFVAAIAPGHNTRALLDTKWIQTQVDGVRTGAYDLTPTIYSEETLRNELAEMNPVLQQLKVVQPPPPDEIKRGDRDERTLLNSFCSGRHGAGTPPALRS
ncbi:hypothetical protein C8R45DRAFT_832638 [Mycena sanguinolenta]|nr:hypothetical protein C8R45DRAFT_832638 [Mycena sanguinolenta]